MATYELDDDLVRRFLENVSHSDAANDHREVQDLLNTLSTQLSIPVPVKIGAVVRTIGAFAPLDQPVTFVRWALDHFTTSPWLQANRDTPYRTDEIGRITEVLSPGVAL